MNESTGKSSRAILVAIIALLCIGGALLLLRGNGDATARVTKSAQNAEAARGSDSDEIPNAALRESTAPEATPAPTPAPEPPRQLRVVSANGEQPLAGVKVHAYSAALWEVGTPIHTPEKTWTSDAEGYATLDEAPPLMTHFAGPKFTFHASGHATLFVPGYQLPNSDSGGVQTIELPVAGTIRGIVLDENDQPVSGVTVGGMGLQGFTQHGGGGVSYGNLQTVFCARVTGADGQFSLDEMIPGKWFVLPYFHPEHGARVSAPVTAEDEEVVLRLESCKVSVRVTVLAVDGSPVPGANVRHVWVSSAGEVVGFITPPFSDAITNAEGEVTLSCQPAGEQMYHAEWMNGSQQVRVRGPVQNPSSGSSELTLQELPFGEVIFRLFARDVETGEPVAGVRLDREGMNPPSGNATTGPDGRLVLRVLHRPISQAGMQMWLYCRIFAPDGYALEESNQYGGSGDFQWKTFQGLRIGENPEVQLALKKVSGRTGIVLGTDGITPVPGTQVRIHHSLRGRLENDSATTSGPEGTFRVQADDDAVLLVVGKHGSLIFQETVSAKNWSPGVPRPFVLKEGTIIRGVVLDPDGNPIGGIPIKVHAFHRLEGIEFGLGTLSEASGADGRFDLGALPAGRYDVSADSHGPLADGAGNALPFKPSEVVSVFLEEEGAPKELTLRLDWAAYIEGTVLDEDRKPIAGAHVFASESSSGGYRHLRDATDVNGRFRITGIPMDGLLSYVGVSAFGYEQNGLRNVDWRAGAVEITLKKAKNLTVVVERPDGSPPNDYHLYTSTSGMAIWNRARGVGASGQAVVDGRFTISVAEGDLPLNLGAVERGPLQEPTGNTGEILVDAIPESGEVRVRLQEGIHVRGIVRDSRNGNRPVPNAKVSMEINNLYGGELPSAPRPVTTGADGRFALGPFLSGQMQLQVSAPGLPSPLLRTVELSADRRVEELEIEIGDAPVLSGRVILPAAIPLTAVEATIEVYGEESGMHNATTLALHPGDGSFEWVFPDDTIHGTITIRAAAQHFLAEVFVQRPSSGEWTVLLDYQDAIPVEFAVRVNGTAPDSGKTRITLTRADASFGLTPVSGKWRGWGMPGECQPAISYYKVSMSDGLLLPVMLSGSAHEGVLSFEGSMTRIAAEAPIQGSHVEMQGVVQAAGGTGRGDIHGFFSRGETFFLPAGDVTLTIHDRFGTSPQGHRVELSVPAGGDLVIEIPAD